MATMRCDSTAKPSVRGISRRRVERSPRSASRLPDRVGPRLRLLFVGINPGLRSVAVGHHFAGPSNRFWALLHESGLTTDRLTWRDDESLPGIGFGLTNLVARPTAGSANLSRDDFVRGERMLRRKVRRLRPRIVVFVGITLVRALEGAHGHRLPRRIRLGEVSGRIEDVPFVVLPNPSGRNASITYAGMLSAYKRLAVLSSAWASSRACAPRTRVRVAARRSPRLASRRPPR